MCTSPSTRSPRCTRAGHRPATLPRPVSCTTPLLGTSACWTPRSPDLVRTCSTTSDQKVYRPYPGDLCGSTFARGLQTGRLSMHTRVLTFSDAKNIDDGVAFVRDTAVPVLQEQ